MSDSPAPVTVARTPPRWEMPALLLGALLLRLWHLGARSLWTDEGSTWSAASAPLHELVRLCAEKDASPPLFYLLTSLALKTGGDEAQLRFVSVVASLGLVWLTYRLARLFLPRGGSLLAAGFCALSPFQLMFAQEARTYTLVACLAMASLYCFLRAAVFGRARAWGPYVLVSALALYTQSIALLGVGVQAAVVVLDARARRRALPWIAALAASVVLYLPWCFISLAQMSRLSHSHWYVHRPDFHSVFQVLRAVFLSPIPLVTPDATATLPGLKAWIPAPLAQLVLTALPVVPLALAARAALGGTERAAGLRILLVALLAPLIAVFVVSFRTPLWLPRYFVLLTPSLCVLLAAGLSGLRPPALGRASRGRTAVLVPFDVDPYRYYNLRLGEPVAAFEVSHPEVPFASDYTPRQLDEMTAAAARRTAGFDEVWVVVRSANSEVRRAVAARTERVAAAGRVETGRWTYTSFAGPLRVARFDRPGTAARQMP